MKRARQGRRLLGSTVAVGLLMAAFVPAAGSSAVAAPAATPAAADDGAHVVSETQIDARTIDLKIQTPALTAFGSSDAMVRLLVPQGWSKTATRTWPVLYLLHGCCDDADYQAWTAYTDVEQFTADKQAIIVMPTAGRVGQYSEWWNYGLSNKPDWPTFHITELLQILERDYHAGTQRAIAGLSMGGYGAMEYAWKYPGVFKAAAAYSAALNITLPPIPEVTYLNLISQGVYTWGSLWGDPHGQASIWTAHNPYDHVDALRGTLLYVSCGNGDPGPIEDPNTPSEGQLLESAALVDSTTFTDQLAAHGIPATVDYYGPGTHSWPYWERALHQSWSLLAQGMGL